MLSDRLARAALSRLAEPGDPRMTGLVAEMGAAGVYAELVGQRNPQGVLTDVGARLTQTDPERELEQAARLGIRFVVPSDPEWPSQLQDLSAAGTLQERGGPPIGLWVTGPARLDQLSASVAIVGSRSSTTYGNRVASDLAAELARAGTPVVSGAAFGIDQAAHRGVAAVDGLTVAVLACGVDRAYPKAHALLLEHLAATGAVMSEAPPGCAPTRVRFLARNRLIAALAQGTVVVEAAARSGALNTANWTVRLNRLLLGVPGPVTSAQSEGVHHLLRQGAASLVTSGADVLELVGRAGEHLLEEPRGPATPRDRLSVRHRQVLDAVPVSQGAGSDSVARAAGLGVLEVRTALSHLEGLGLVEWGDDGWRLASLART